MSQVSKVVYGNTTVIDITDSTVNANNLLSGNKAYGADGEPVIGALSVGSTINVTTTDSSLFGETLTLSDGTTTLTTAFDNSGDATFQSVLLVGTLTLSCDGNNMTISVPTYGTYNIVFTAIPEGATVTPTDDIQTWLKCANITDKEYTTLAEVLADQETFETLIADSNACDYMARSTTWAGDYSVAIPKMTSETTPSGVVSEGNHSSGSHPDWHAFDGTTTNYWQSNTSPTWLCYKFNTAVIANKIYIVKDSKTYTAILQGSNTGSNDWVNLATITFDSSTTKDVEFVNNTAYLYYRFYTSDAPNYIQIFTIQLSNVGVPNDSDAMALIGKYDYCSVALLKNNTWASAIANSDYFEGVLNTRVPIMTSDTAPSGQVIYSTANNGGSYRTYGAFDGNTSTYWMSQDSTVASNSAWCGYDFGYPLYLGKYELAQDNNRITGWVIEGTNDKTGTWYEVASVSNTTIPTTMTKYNVDTYGTAYRYYRFRITSTLTAPNSSPMREIQFYGHLVKEVLLPLVPAMTSNTTPSGEVSATSAMSGYEAYKAFDNNTSTAWIASSGSSGFDMSLTYQFANAVCAKVAKVLVYHDGNAHAKNYSIEASNDGSSYTTLTSGEFANINTTQTVDLSSNTTEYQYYRLRITSMYASANVAITELQYYDTTVQTNIVHSSANDTIYYLDEGSPVIVATTNSDGDGILDFNSLEDGTYTFYSSVSKDPLVLANAFSRTVRITNTQYGETTEMYLVPDTAKTLYWYGYNGGVESCSSANGWTIISNYTFNEPTYNTNYVYLNGQQSRYSAFGNKRPITPTKVHTIMEFTYTTYTGTYGIRVGNSDSKSVVYNNMLASLDTKNVITHIEALTTKSYLYTYGQDARGGNVYALWYE